MSNPPAGGQIPLREKVCQQFRLGGIGQCRGLQIVRLTAFHSDRAGLKGIHLFGSEVESEVVHCSRDIVTSKASGVLCIDFTTNS